jgi:hypothetical protein
MESFTIISAKLEPFRMESFIKYFQQNRNLSEGIIQKESFRSNFVNLNDSSWVIKLFLKDSFLKDSILKDSGFADFFSERFHSERFQLAEKDVSQGFLLKDSFLKDSILKDSGFTKNIF